MLSQEKQKKLAYVARRYYLEDQRQSDIAKELGVSRPLISRMLSEARQLGADPHFLYLPALPDSLEETRLLCSTEVYHQNQRQWDGIDTALVNIGNYPSSPDFASLVRYGDLLQRHHACGRMLVYYFNEDGTVIQSDQDFAIQVPLETLRRCPNIVGVCSANTSAKALRGALRSGILTHIVPRANLAQMLLS